MSDRLFGFKVDSLDNAFVAQCNAFAHCDVMELSTIYTNWSFSATRAATNSINREFSIRMLNWLHTRIQELLSVA